jgi:phosphatidylglycerophosphatase A
MYIDETIVASLVVILGTIGFLGGFAYFIYQDQKKSALSKKHK